jgi:UDP-glucose 4-epimerase
MVKVFDAGGCEFIGSNLLDRLLEREDITSLIVVDDLWTGLRQDIAHIRDPIKRTIEWSLNSASLKRPG